MKEVRNIRFAMLNGKNVKFFEVWNKVGVWWVCAGQFHAPTKIANKDLLAYTEEN